MATYIAAFQGYLADVPRVWFKTCNGKMYYYDELTQASFTPNVQYQEVNGGWSLFPVAYLPGSGTLDCSITCAKFAADMYEMANGATFVEDANAAIPYTEYVTLSGSTLTLDSAVGYSNILPSSIVINGLSEGAANDFTFSNGVVTLKNASIVKDPASPVLVSYQAKVANAYTAKVTNQSAAIGELWLKWPVYQGGSDATGQGCSESAVKGYIVAHVFKARVTTMPGFDSSYKSVGNNQLTISAMDAKRADNNSYELTYYQV